MDMERITPEDVAKIMGIKNPETIRVGLRNGTFPIGFAYQGKKNWVYIIPKEPFEHFARTGRIKEV